jgi:hypothetical protein
VKPPGISGNKWEYLKDKINDHPTHCKIKNIRDFYREIKQTNLRGANNLEIT